MVQSLERLGISANIRLVDISQYTNRMRKHDYDAFVQSYTSSFHQHWKHVRTFTPVR